MNQKDLLIRRREALNELDRMKNIGINTCKYNSHNSMQHENAKWKLFTQFRRAGYDVVTECIFSNQSRCDILILDTFTIVEVLHSEKVDDCWKKCESYPSKFSIMLVDSSLKLIDKRQGLI